MSVVDIEAIVATYLREVGFRARNTPPDESHRDEPWVQIILISAPSDDVISVEYLIGYLVQFSCYAGVDGGQPEANATGYAVRDALEAMRTTTFDEAVVTSVKFVAMSRVPDDQMEPARERYIVDARIHAHPKQGS